MQRRFVMLLLAGFAVAALLLAGVGIYGTVSQAVAQRTQEIGVRMALGASPASVLRLVFGEGVRMMPAGWCGGAAAAVAGVADAGHAVRGGPMDPAAFLAALLRWRLPRGLLHSGPPRHACRSPVALRQVQGKAA